MRNRDIQRELALEIANNVELGIRKQFKNCLEKLNPTNYRNSESALH